MCTDPACQDEIARLDAKNASQDAEISDLLSQVSVLKRDLLEHRNKAIASGAHPPITIII